MYDYIIVGAGSAGCVLAYRLSEDPETKVLLVEAGPEDRHPLMHMPMGSGKILQGTSMVWTNKVHPPHEVHNPDELWRRGKVLGGSSSVNGMVYTRGHPAQYDRWVELGNPGWGWDAMLPAFKGIENFAGGDAAVHGTAGRLHVSMHDETTPEMQAILAAGVTMGLRQVNDFTAHDVERVGFLPRTIHEGRRWSAASAFLKPARARPNLEVRTGCKVERVLIENGAATGIVCRQGGVRQEFHATAELVLAAGALNTPKLLMLSGIGAGDRLQALGIPVVRDSPRVGLQMQEHFMVPITFRFKPGLGTNRQLQGPRVLLNTLKYFFTRRGVMSWAPFVLGAAVKTSAELQRPDALLTISPLSIDFSPGEFGNVEKEPGLMMFAYQCDPQSRGKLSIKSNDPDAPLDIWPNYLATDTDRRVTTEAFRAMRRLAACAPLADLVVAETAPGAACDSDADLLKHFRRTGTTAYHSVGTCAMGNDPASVVDAELKVRGIDRLRVVDCSVMPTLPGMHTNGPVMALAWCACDRMRRRATFR